MKIGKMNITRRILMATASVGMLGLMAGQALAEAKGEIVVLNWLAGSELDTMHALEKAFQDKNPGVQIREVLLTAKGDARGAIRTALLSGEKADLLINTWPAFRAELVDNGMLRPLDASWDAGKWSDNVSDAWRNLGKVGDVTYGIQYVFGNRSGIFYRNDVMAKAGLKAPPADWVSLLASFDAMNKVGVTPMAVAAKVWAHAEWFETLLLRTGGVETASKLAAHQIPWTDPAVKKALQMFAELLKANCCGDVNQMLATDWDNAADNVLKNGTHGYDLIGMWVNGRAASEYKLKEGADYGMFQFPAMGLGHDDTSSVDAKEFVSLNSGSNPEASDAFLGWLGSAEAANIIAKGSQLSTSNKVDTSLYGPVAASAAEAVAKAKPQFVLGDLLPGDVVDEYRVQLQHFLQDPSDANIDKVLAAIEAKAKEVYK